MNSRRYLVVLGLAVMQLSGCSQKQSESQLAGDNMPTFSLAWSEYPSWSVFGVADELGLVDGESGKLGIIEVEHRVDIVLREASYDSCLNMFGSGDCDAVCITNMDALIVSPTRACVAVMPTSTSAGADACLVTPSIDSVEALKGKAVYGLKGTVSEYCFVRCLEERGLDEKDFEFTNQDPGAAATNMQQGAATHEAIMVWNPFVLQTLRDRSDVRVLFDSTEIPGEIVDMVAVGRDVLDQPSADRFLKAVRDTFYRVCQELEGERGDEVLVALGKKFSNLGLEDMQTVVQQTVFYDNPEEAGALFESEKFSEIMQTVESFCVTHGLVTDPSVGFGPDAEGVKLRFDASFLR